jgi:hypothetical protein
MYPIRGRAGRWRPMELVHCCPMPEWLAKQRRRWWEQHNQGLARTRWAKHSVDQLRPGQPQMAPLVFEPQRAGSSSRQEHSGTSGSDPL